jgi:hypothetical protein
VLHEFVLLRSRISRKLLTRTRSMAFPFYLLETLVRISTSIIPQSLKAPLTSDFDIVGRILV